LQLCLDCRPLKANSAKRGMLRVYSSNAHPDMLVGEKVVRLPM
jgi:hypothetical protein